MKHSDIDIINGDQIQKKDSNSVFTNAINVLWKTTRWLVADKTITIFDNHNVIIGICIDSHIRFDDLDSEFINFDKGLAINIVEFLGKKLKKYSNSGCKENTKFRNTLYMSFYTMNMENSDEISSSSLQKMVDTYIELLPERKTFSIYDLEICAYTLGARSIVHKTSGEFLFGISGCTLQNQLGF